MSCLTPLILFCQTISGRIENIHGEKVPFTNLITKDSLNAAMIKEFTIAKNGFYSITLTKSYKTLVVEISANKYQKDVFVIDNFDSSKNYIHNFVLVKDATVQLKEVVVTAKVSPFQIKGDTVNYNVAAYRDGTERKIQDVIKKLPGIEVNEKTGEIKYKGKSVETVKFDGDDLFASNYSIGTKNINVDMVEQVQAIENYSDNPLLKGIESGDKVALNLTLKKKKTDYSGSVDLGSGIMGSKSAIDVSTDLLGISKKYKSFATLSYNNVGINNTPFDYFSYNPNIEQLKEQELLAKKYIPDTYFDTEIDPQRSNINNSFFGSYNATFKVGSKLSIKTNLYYLNDKISSEQSNVTSNNIYGQQFITSDKYSIKKKPTQYRGDIEAKYNISKNSLLEYSIRYKAENINTSNYVLQNSTTDYNTYLKANDNYFKQKLTYTNKISHNTAVQVVAQHTINNLPQLYSFLPAIYDSATYNSNIEKSGFKKNTYLLQSNLLGNSSKGKYNLALGTEIQNINYTSYLKGINDTNTTLINGFTNNFNYRQIGNFFSGNYNLQFKRLRFNPNLTVTYLHQHLLDNALNRLRDTGNVLIEPTFSIVYKLNNYSAVLITTGYKQKPFSEEYFISNPLYVSNRFIQSNEVDLNIQKSKIVSLFYLIDNLYKQFQLNLGGTYSANKGNYFSDLLVQQNSTKSIYFFLPEYFNLLSLNFMIEKYIPFLQGTVRLKNDYSLQEYKNIVNNSSLRNNKTQSFANELFFKTAFDWKINFENVFKYRVLTAKQEGSTEFDNNSLNNNFKIIIKPAKRFFAIFSSDYFLPNTSKKQKYLFLDIDLTYQTKNKLYDFRLKARNITNNKYLNQFDTNDYSTTNFQTNLLPRHILFSISRNF
ncbi:MAG: hypothetical protein QM763_10970 [Agriterribacter sp.]